MSEPVSQGNECDMAMHLHALGDSERLMTCPIVSRKFQASRLTERGLPTGSEKELSCAVERFA